MDQARYYVCETCFTPIPSGHKFCGTCGASAPDSVLAPKVAYFSEMQNPAKARLLLVHGDGMDGLSYHLKAEQHIVGRAGQIEFAKDPFVSPRHANLFYRDGQLVVRDEASVNGVFFRIRGTVELAAGDQFICGGHLFRLDPTPKMGEAADPDGTFFYSSPRQVGPFRVSQILEGGAPGLTIYATSTGSVGIGREGQEINFPEDLHMSLQHATVSLQEGHYFLTDHDSRNGTYVRLKAEQPLTHGDYLVVGSKLLRVELNV